MDFLADAEATLERKFEFLLNAGRVEVLLEDEEVTFLVEHDELAVAECHDAVDPEGDVRARRLHDLDFGLTALF